jgi:nicotinate phosphoribosyltransferase
VAGVKATSNVLAGSMFGIPVTGTMAHSYIQAHDSEYRAMENFARIYPETILLVDTYDTLEGVGKVVELAKRLGRDFKVSGVRLDSGDMADLARESRQILDRAGLHHVSIFASGSMDEYEIARLLDSGAPINGFGVGTHMGVSDDAPYLDMVYKLTSHAGKGRLKTSPGKKILPGAKQVYRMEDEAEAVRDVIAGYDEDHPGRPLLVPVMENGRRLPAGLEDLDAARQRRVRELAALPDHVRGMDPADPPYQVEVSRELGRRQKELIKELTA